MVQFASYLRRVLCKARLIFPRINGPSVPTLQRCVALKIDFGIVPCNITLTSLIKGRHFCPDLDFPKEMHFMFVTLNTVL